MALWIVKAFIQKGISFLPYKLKINYFFQKYITKGINLTDELFESKLYHCQQHVSAFKKYGGNRREFSSFEIGTGWYPIVPICMYLFDASNIYSADIHLFLTKDRFRQTIQKFIAYHESSKLSLILKGYNVEKIESLQKILKNNDEITQVLHLLRIKTVIGDIRKLNPDIYGQIDLIHSNNTFEHIEMNQLNDILLFLRRIVKPDGVMSHFIDLSDHFSHLDKKITQFNFLKFSDKEWNLIDNKIQPQNRLRIRCYRELFKISEWNIIEEELIKGNKNDLKRIKLNKKFLNIDTNELIITHALLISKPIVNN